MTAWETESLPLQSRMVFSAATRSLRSSDNKLSRNSSSSWTVSAVCWASETKAGSEERTPSTEESARAARRSYRLASSLADEEAAGAGQGDGGAVAVMAAIAAGEETEPEAGTGLGWEAAVAAGRGSAEAGTRGTGSEVEILMRAICTGQVVGQCHGFAWHPGHCGGAHPGKADEDGDEKDEDKEGDEEDMVAALAGEGLGAGARRRGMVTV